MSVRLSTRRANAALERDVPWPRVLGAVRHYRIQASGTVEPVIISDEIRQCTAFIYYESRNHGRRPCGTALLAVQPFKNLPDMAFTFLVTARHIIEGARADTDADHLLLRVNGASGADFFEIPFGHWGWHPSDDWGNTGKDWLRPSCEWERMDVAIALCPEEIAQRPSVLFWDIHDAVTTKFIFERRISAGQEVAVVGLYRTHIGEDRNIPVVRAGTIAVMPDEAQVVTKLGKMRAYLIESRSTGGLSGSPVFWIPDPTYYPNDSPRLLGIVQGHYNAEAPYPYPEAISEGIAIVVPAYTILEAWEDDVLVEDREKTEADQERDRGSRSVPQDGPETA
jgi:hypothetical protein